MDLSQRYKAWLFDGDGVLYTGNTPVEGANDFVNSLREKGKPVVLITNNSTSTVEEYRRKLDRMGLQFDQIYTSAYTAISRINGKSVFVLGEEGIHDACKKAGITTDENDYDIPDYVVVGMDRTLTYEKLRKAVWYILQGARFVATNPDRTFPLKDSIAPGAGSMIAAVEACVGHPPEFIAGKPEVHLFRQACGDLGFEPDEVVMVGDRYETDILGASRAGIDSVLVRTGIASGYSIEDLERIRSSKHPPTYVVNTLNEIS